MRPHVLALALPLVLATPFAAHAQMRTVENLQPLLIEAVRLGDAEGILGGRAKEFMAQTFGAHAPIVIKVRRVRPIQPAGCARVEVTTPQEQVAEPKTHTPAPGEPTHNPPTDQRLVYEIDFCENGRVPAEGGGRL